MVKVLEDLQYVSASIDIDLAGVALEVRVTNNPAIKLYESLGFEIEYVRPGYYRDGETGLIMIYRYRREVYSNLDKRRPWVGSDLRW